MPKNNEELEEMVQLILTKEELEELANLAILPYNIVQMLDEYVASGISQSMPVLKIIRKEMEKHQESVNLRLY